MTTANSALPLPTTEYSVEYMNRLVRQLNLAINKMNAVSPLTVGSDLTSQVAGYPVSGLTIVNIPTSPTGLPAGSVWSDGGTLKIVS
jgi:hypothetical protein